MTDKMPEQTRRYLVDLRDNANDYTRPSAQRLLDKHDANQGTGKDAGSKK